MFRHSLKAKTKLDLARLRIASPELFSLENDKQIVLSGNV